MTVEDRHNESPPEEILADSMEIDLNDGFESDEEQAKSRIVTTRFRAHVPAV